ncbi:bifunctional metallophosphatase/5'-nucleotidase [Halalkalibacter krulwichiae]|uniref:Trifunctional nucleotide phosphoesterase protein YfkN n=1 Tax=Halalkalibacter krulwichiae TaxID=199441 RepID=A0A1X9MEX2_9BACI|nr:bifunctional UDP-sugar hydrolase/5'-nucleotidase [Halalkalibacter krulwichiae]ARK31966.1 Trifunctional nucleotide phosphoesterase protein YfkN precursor [Halalkalibacter krulwichiae]
MSVKQLTIFHTNDIHSCFDNWSQIVSYIKRHRDEDTLYVDLGDHTDRSNPLTEATYGKGNIELLNEAKVDYVTVGNNEGITFSKEQLGCLYEEATFPVVVANVFDQNDGRPDWMHPYIIHTQKDGLKIGIIGLTAPFYRFYEQLGWKIQSPQDLLAHFLPIVKKEADIVVFMSHLGLQKDEEIAEQFPEIDVILGAHTHHVLPTGKWCGTTLIAQTGKHGLFLGQVTIDYDVETKQVLEKRAALVDVKDKEEDVQTNNILDRMASKAKEVLSEPVAVISKPLVIEWQKQTDFGQILCDAVTEWCGQKIGMLNAGVILDSLETGEVTKADIHRICPHPINPCVLEVTGEQLEASIKKALTEDMTHLELKGFGFRGKVLGKMLFTGITIEENDDSLSIFILNEPLKKDKLYSLATLDMYTFGYLFPELTAAHKKKYFMPEFLRDVLAKKLSDQLS